MSIDDDVKALAPDEHRLTDAELRARVGSIWRLLWRVANHEPRSFWLGWLFFVVFFAMPAVIGFVLARGFDALDRGDSSGVYRVAVALVALEALRMGAVTVGVMFWVRSWVHIQTLLRGNMLAAQVTSGGPAAGRPVNAAGEAVTHFRDDTNDIAQLLDAVVDTGGAIVFTAIAGFLLGTADARAAAVFVIPLIAVVVVTRMLGGPILRYRAADRAATGAVTGFVGDVMAAATTVKVNGAVDNVLARFKTLVDRRGVTAVRDRVLTEGMRAFARGAADVGFGLVIVVSAAAIATGAFSVGTLALFASYLGWLSFLPMIVGVLLARRRQGAVAFDRMRRLVAGQDVDNTASPRSLPIERWQHPVRPDPRRPERVPLQRLDVVDLAATYPAAPGHAGRRNGGRAVAGVRIGPVSLRADRGSFTVITGPVGSGKSTLLRAICGLAWQAEVSGEVRWNGEVVADRAAFFVPPNASLLSQVPQLISDSVHDNVSLGPMAEDRILEALEIAAIAEDVSAMPARGATMIGPRGLRLSGGQRQRLATARALVHRPELILLDDLSSAVDVETELALWDNLAAAGLTVIAVSHRDVAFDRADQVIRL